MDVFLLSRLLRELIIDNERVPVPGLGYLTTEPLPAKFSEDGLAIIPPGRKISFKAEKMASGEMIWKYYSEESGVDEETARAELEAFMTQLIPTLKTKRVIDLQGIGRFRCTSDGNVYFAAAEADNVFNSAFNFEPVTLKPLNKFDTLINISEIESEGKSEEPASIISDEPYREVAAEPEVEGSGSEEIAAVVTPEQEVVVPEAEPEIVPEQDLHQEPDFIPEPSAITEEEKPVREKPAKRSSGGKKIWRVLLYIIIALVAIVIIFYILLSNNCFDSLLYTEEELELIKSLT